MSELTGRLEKWALWYLRYMSQYRPGQHPMPPRKDRDRT